MYTVLIAENHRPTALGLKAALSKNYQVVCKTEFGSAAEFLFSEQPDATILGTVDGKDPKYICKSMRQNGCESALLCIADSKNRDQGISMLEAGADDYINKPLYEPEIRARVQRIILRPPVSRSEVLNCGGCTLNPGSLSITSQTGDVLLLKPREFRILRCLVLHEGNVLSRSQLVSKTSSPHRQASEDAIDVHISKLRQKLHGFMKVEIHSVYGIGYRLVSW